ncbi:hypothetical protein [Endozoicomonas sp.]|uniref:hypothetical protein n=1 Tax=Endozoicomonas sp. TaxID=1892382 RepID=UPI003AF9B8A1
MTNQLTSSLTIDDASYRVTKADPHPIFHPDMLGIKVSSIGTFCWAGYIVSYECKDGQLFARSMTLGVFDDDPLVNGVKPDPLPKPDDPAYAFILGRSYTDVWLPLDYSGEVILGKDWVGNLGRGNHGSAPAVEYNDVKKVVFLEGRLQKITDISEQYVAERQALIEQEEEKREKQWSIEERKRRRVRFKRKVLEFFTRKKQPMATHRDGF